MLFITQQLIIISYLFHFNVIHFIFIIIFSFSLIPITQSNMYAASFIIIISLLMSSLIILTLPLMILFANSICSVLMLFINSISFITILIALLLFLSVFLSIAESSIFIHSFIST